MNEAPALRPTEEGHRLHSMDVLRGLALLGILVVNVEFFGLPLPHALDPSTRTSPGDRSAWFVMHAFFEYKFISIFSLLFGAGLALQARRAEKTGESFLASLVRRQGLLLAIGLAHGILLWYGDILTAYAAVGLVVGVLVIFAPVAALPIGIGLLAISALTGLAAGLGGMGAYAAPHEDPAYVLRGAEAIGDCDLNVFTSQWITAEIAAYREGPWVDALAFRSASFFLGLVAMVVYVWRVAGFMCIGAWLASRRLFHGEARRIRVVLIMLGLAGAALEVLVSREMLRGAPSIWTGVGHDLGATLMALGITAAVVWCSVDGRRWLAFLAPAGRCALSVYLGETVLATALFYSHGLGRFGLLDGPSRLAAAGSIFLILLISSHLWRRAFRMGPVEWLWRWVTYGARPPLREASSARAEIRPLHRRTTD